MLRRIVPLLVVVAAFAVGCGMGGKKVALKPSDINPGLSSLDLDNPFLKESWKVEYMETQMANYDAFFRDSASIQGSVILADMMLKDVSATLTQIATGQGITVPAEGADWAAIAKEIAAKKDSLKPEELSAVKQHLDKLTLLVDVVKAVPEKATALIATGQSLAGSATADFAGPNALKLPDVVSGLADSATKLKDAGERAPNIATSIVGIVEALAAFAG